MSISDIKDPNSVTKAAEEFDSLGREAFLKKYGFGKATSYFLKVGNRRYDSKAIIGAAHGYEFGKPLSADEFSGGMQTVQRKLEELGFTVESDGDDETRTPLDLRIGDVLSNRDIVNIFGVSNTGGMRLSRAQKHLVIVSDHTKSLYDDRWEGDTLHYTGMGTAGDQSLSNQNRTLAESNESDTLVYLFEVYSAGRYQFYGQVELTKPPFQEKQIDKNGNSRSVWMFPLRSKSPDSMPPPTLKELAEIRANRQKALGKMPVEELRNRAAQTDKRPPTRTAQTEEFVRNEAVAAYVKKAAYGSCDLCHQDAPFLNRRGEPYLECHHVQHLAKGGDDTIDNAVALCPNCHRKMHALDLASDRQRLLRRVQERERVFIEPSKL